MVNLNQDLNFAFISWLQLILKKKKGILKMIAFQHVNYAMKWKI